MKKLITLLLLLTFLAAVPVNTVHAQQYGQKEVLGDKDEPETKGGKPLPETGLAENAAVGLAVLGMGAGYYLYRSRKSGSVTFK